MTLPPSDETRSNVENTDVQVFWDEFDLIFNTLYDDFDQIDKQLRQNDAQVWRRAYCRTFFAYVEGHVESLKQLFLFFDWWKADEGTELKLRNRRLLTTQDGSAKVVTAYLPLVENVKLAFNVLAAAARLEPLIPNEDKGWQMLAHAVKIRNRIVHPKKSQDLFITDGEIAHLRETAKWYISKASLVLKKRAQAELASSRRLRQVAKRYFEERKSAKSKGK